MDNFSNQALLAMDYHVLQRYADEAVLKKPSLIGLLMSLHLKEIYSAGESGEEHMARLRCISAFIGAPDPCEETYHITEEKRT